MYLGIKHSHLFFITMTFILFNLRFWLRTMKPEKPLPSALRFVPHINDTLLLFSGMMLMQIGHWQPFGASKWLGVKLFLVLVYIILGVICLRSRPRSPKWFALYAVSIACIACIASLAYFKPL